MSAFVKKHKCLLGLLVAWAIAHHQLFNLENIVAIGSKMTHFLVLGCCWCLAKCPHTCPFQWEPNTFFCHEKCSLSVVSCKVHFTKCSLTAITLKLHFAKCSFTQTTLKLHITKCSFNVITLKLHFARCSHQNLPSEISVCHPPPPQTYLAHILKDHKYKLVTSSGSNVPWNPCIPRWSSQAH